MEIVFDTYQNNVEEYDALLTGAGESLNAAAFAYTDFIVSILSRISAGEIICDINIPFYGSDGYELRQVKKIFISRDDEQLSLEFENGMTTSWIDLNVSAQDYICQSIFMEIKIYDMTRSLFPETGKL